MKNILITGGAGFIGTHLSTLLQKQGHYITILDSLTEQIHGDANYVPNKNVTFIKGDVRNARDVREALKGVDAVYHLAAETGTGQSMYEISRYVDVNEIGTAVLLEELAKCEKKDIQFILASSRSIYGEGAYRQNNGDIFQPQPRSYDQLNRGIWDFLDIDGNVASPIPTPIKSFSSAWLYLCGYKILTGNACNYSLFIKRYTVHNFTISKCLWRGAITEESIYRHNFYFL